MTRKGKATAAFRTEEEETAHGPTDYAPLLNELIVGIVEAKKLTIGLQRVLAQADRQRRTLVQSSAFHSTITLSAPSPTPRGASPTA